MDYSPFDGGSRRLLYRLGTVNPCIGVAGRGSYFGLQDKQVKRGQGRACGGATVTTARWCLFREPHQPISLDHGRGHRESDIKRRPVAAARSAKRTALAEGGSTSWRYGLAGLMPNIAGPQEAGRIPVEAGMRSKYPAFGKIVSGEAVIGDMHVRWC